MDRSFLSVPAVVEASREFVCARLLTYESAEEGKFLAGLFRTRSGLLENTVFAVLAPDGKTPLVEPGRSPSRAFPGPPDQAARDLAETLARIARRHPGKGEGERRLPAVVDLRRGLNLASCEIQPLVVIASRGQARARIESALAPLSWSRDFIGRFAYAATDPEALQTIAGAPAREGVLVVQPDAYGLKGTLLASAETLDADGLRRALAAGLRTFAGETKETRAHIEEGRRRGARWETAIPDTDPGPPGAPPRR